MVLIATETYLVEWYCFVACQCLNQDQNPTEIIWCVILSVECVSEAVSVTCFFFLLVEHHALVGLDLDLNHHPCLTFVQ